MCCNSGVSGRGSSTFCRRTKGFAQWYRLSACLPPCLLCAPQLSAHQIATELGPSGRLGPPGWYSGELLSLAHDLGNRLLPAFDTPLGIPVHRVNLRKGIPRGAGVVLAVVWVVVMVVVVASMVLGIRGSRKGGISPATRVVHAWRGDKGEG